MTTSTKYYVDAQGNYLGAFVSLTDAEGVTHAPTPPMGAIEVPGGPNDGTDVWIGGAWQARPSVDQVAAERERRLALGFHYNFNDTRGIHLIGTTEADMKGWKEVTDAAQAFINDGEGATAFIGIVTNTGACSVTPNEWTKILKAAFNARQPFWAASFTLQSMNPIPADYAADSRWPAQP